MATRAALRFVRECSVYRKVKSNNISKHSFSTASSTTTHTPQPPFPKKVPQFSKKIISNTTIQRPDSVCNNPVAEETGGLSGKPLCSLSTDILKDMYVLTKGKIPLIGCGGVGSGEDAYKKIRAGATLVQLYTAFAYGGPALIPKIKAELAQCLERDGYQSIHEAVGADCR
ncbi:hypothetical protein DH2020_027479 [Rehmannia glutinosa]|uniref:Dihydroorotate dehydrogenase catalytic domain-containing protein n=1 Tax=Rehmannia glutinosa TaxID=99300 RepID=A0ABR0VU28_REHGL